MSTSQTQTPLIPTEPGTKTGCLSCPLFHWTEDYVANADAYFYDSARVATERNKYREGHRIRCRNLHEPRTPVDVLFVLDAPDTDDDRYKRVSGGRSGSFLRESAKELLKGDGPELTHGYEYLVKCPTIMAKDPAKTVLTACTVNFVADTLSRNPRVLVAVGGLALKYLTGETGINKLTGKRFTCTVPGLEHIPVIALLSPGYVFKFDYELPRFEESFQAILDCLEGKLTEDTCDVEVITKSGRVVEVLDELLASGKPIAFDTETGHLHWNQELGQFPPLLCISFSNEEGKAYVVPYDHVESPFTTWVQKKDGSYRNQRAKATPLRLQRRKRVRNAIRRFLKSAQLKIAQNGKFDAKHLFHTFGVWPRNVRDSMLLHYVLDEERGGHGLKMLAYSASSRGGYDRELDEYKATHGEADPDSGGSYANIPGKILFTYAGYDAEMTVRVWRTWLEDPDYKDSPRRRALVNELFPPLSDTLARMEYAGAAVDVELAKLVEADVQREMAEIRAKVREIPQVRAYEAQRLLLEQKKRKTEKGKSRVTFAFNPGSDKQLAAVLYDYYKERPLELTDGGFERIKVRLQKSSGDSSWGGMLAQAIHNKEWNLFSVKSDVLHEYERGGNALAPLIIKYRELSVTSGTFLQSVIHQSHNGFIHGTFSVAGTQTGRLSSANPNLQNASNKDPRIKKLYITRFGSEGVLLQLDYSQIELRVAASYYFEPVMIEAYRNGEDLHKLAAIDISGLTKEAFEKLPEKTADQRGKKQWRTRAKRVNFGVVYGAVAMTIVSTLKKDGVFITLEEAEQILERFFAKRPGLVKGIKKTQRVARKQGYIETFTGRKRRVPQVFSNIDQIVNRALRQIINFPIQSMASDMTLMSLALIDRAMRKAGLKSKMILSVHDSIVFDCVVSEVEQVAKLARNIMENLPTLAEELLPGLDWTWLQTPIVADCEVGRNWGSMVEFDPDAFGTQPEEPLFKLDEETKKKEIARSPHSLEELVAVVDYKAAA